jgi:osmotically-inducible protein OsmY
MNGAACSSEIPSNSAMALRTRMGPERHVRCSTEGCAVRQLPRGKSLIVTTTYIEDMIMSTAAIIETDLRLRDAVIRQLDWDPTVDASALGVAAAEGVVTLTGFIDSYAGKLAAERAVKRIRGVRAVANDIVVRLRQPRTDEIIARDCANALANPPALADVVQPVVRYGHVTLTGRVQWLFQRELAEDLVRHVRGVLGVHNHITVIPRATERDVTQRIVRALHHDADVDARHITVSVDAHTVTLAGTAATWAQKDAAERAAGQAPGVTHVNNHITIVCAPHAEPVDEIC